MLIPLNSYRAYFHLQHEIDIQPPAVDDPSSSRKSPTSSPDFFLSRLNDSKEVLARPRLLMWTASTTKPSFYTAQALVASSYRREDSPPDEEPTCCFLSPATSTLPRILSCSGDLNETLRSANTSTHLAKKEHNSPVLSKTAAQSDAPDRFTSVHREELEYLLVGGDCLPVERDVKTMTDCSYSHREFAKREVQLYGKRNNDVENCSPYTVDAICYQDSVPRVYEAGPGKCT
ncbi:hypothetical protein ARMGADRAFT_1091522 [Armillaria gallica]|uniref:Uncharacterized protein n=1 Tax=Armillaria gallica TaxID=47427 RepID=A0A2H3CDU1_ARMGA|nr:hypothetical protein ARMGADRAFT_1091522 [Armillaria gallica]